MKDRVVKEFTLTQELRDVEFAHARTKSITKKLQGLDFYLLPWHHYKISQYPIAEYGKKIAKIAKVYQQKDDIIWEWLGKLVSKLTPEKIIELGLDEIHYQGKEQDWMQLREQFREWFFKQYFKDYEGTAIHAVGYCINQNEIECFDDIKVHLSYVLELEHQWPSTKSNYLMYGLEYLCKRFPTIEDCSKLPLIVIEIFDWMIAHTYDIYEAYKTKVRDGWVHPFQNGSNKPDYEFDWEDLYLKKLIN